MTAKLAPPQAGAVLRMHACIRKVLKAEGLRLVESVPGLRVRRWQQRRRKRRAAAVPLGQGELAEHQLQHAPGRASTPMRAGGPAMAGALSKVLLGSL